MKKLYQKYQGREIEDAGSCVSDDFYRLANQIKRAFTNAAKENGIELVKFAKGHYYIFGFFKKDEKYVYFSWNAPRWSSRINFNATDAMSGFMLRTAKHDKDYTGGFNNFTNLFGFMDTLNKLMA